MDYEKKYKGALNTAKAAYGTGAYDDQTLEAIFPELTESEDEQVMRIIRKRMCYDPVPISDEDRRIVEAWFEKQKEQKHPDGCFTCDEYKKGYDEAYLNEKIAKASKTWEGVDVDKYMAEMRGYEQPCEDLEKEIENTIDNTFCDMNGIAYLGITGYATVEDMKYIARHFYELGKGGK